MSKVEPFMDSSSDYLSPHVRNIASLVYSEFERLVSRYGEGVVDGIVPIMIRTLEEVDQLHETNEMLHTSCAHNAHELKSLAKRLEQEIKFKHDAEERVMALEDEIAEIKICKDKEVADLARQNRVLEARCNAAKEHVSRLEAKEAELLRDLANSKSHCNELLCSHIAYIERTHLRMRSLGVDASLSDLQNSIIEEKNNHLEETNIEPTSDFGTVKPSLMPSFEDHNLEESSFEVLEEATDYEPDLDEVRSNRPSSDESDDAISKVSDECEFLGTKSLEAEVRKLVAENQELTEMKQVCIMNIFCILQALNVLKDDLLNKIDDLTCANTVLNSELDACRKNLVDEQNHSRERENQLIQRIRRLTNRMLVADIPRSKLARCLSLCQVNEPPSIKMRHPRSCSPVLPTMKPTGSPLKMEHRSDSKKPSLVRESTNASSSGSSMRLSKREIARIIVERNYYKENYYEMKDRLRGLDIARRTQPSLTEVNLRKRELATALFGKIIDTVHSVAADVKNSISELTKTKEEPEPPSRTSAALWNILGNFVGQAITYTTDAVVGTGNDLTLDVSRPMIAARVNSKIPIAPQQQPQP